MAPGRKLSQTEAALWARVVSTVEPLKGRAKIPPRNGEGDQPPTGAGAGAASTPLPPMRTAARTPPPPPRSAPAPRAVEDIQRNGLDSTWDRKLARGQADPDFTLDLHGCSLDAAHGRLLHGLTQAKAMGARLVLLVTGNPRPASSADRGSQRGAIRAKVTDWLSVSEHALDIAAIRGAHRRHGGQGALYIVLKRRR